MALSPLVREFLENPFVSFRLEKEVQEWVARVEEEELAEIEAPAGHPIWGYLGQRLPAARLTSGMARRIAAGGGWVPLFYREDLPTEFQAPALPDFSGTVRSLVRRGEYSEAMRWGTVMKAYVRHGGEIPEAELSAAIEEVLKERESEDRDEYHSLACRFCLAGALARLPGCTPRQLVQLARRFGRVSSWDTDEALTERDIQLLFVELWEHPRFPLSALPRLLREGMGTSALRALAEVPAARRNPEVRRRLQGNADGRVLYLLALEAPAEELRLLWRRLLEEAPHWSARVLDERAGALPLSPEEVMPLLGARDASLRLSAIGALARLQGTGDGARKLEGERMAHPSRSGEQRAGRARHLPGHP